MLLVRMYVTHTEKVTRCNELVYFTSLRPRWYGRYVPDDTFKCIFLDEKIWNSIKISLKFVPKGPIDNNLALVQIMAWHWAGDNQLSVPMVVILPTHISVTRPQWLNHCGQTTKKCDTYSARCVFCFGFGLVAVSHIRIAYTSAIKTTLKNVGK